MRKEIHRPPHLYLDNAVYFITAGTVNKKPIMDNDAKLTSFASLLQQVVQYYNGVAGHGSASEDGDAKLGLRPRFATPAAKGVAEQSSASAQRVHLIAWAVLANHYHLLMYLRKSATLSNLIRKLHSNSAIQFNRIDNTSGRKAWYQYWDTCIRDDKTMYTRLNYIHNNPIKHGYTNDLSEYKFSSYHLYVERFGEEWVDDIWERYPVIDYIEGDDF